MLVAVQVPQSENEVIRHPAWKHFHVVWRPLYITGEGALEIDHQKQVFQTRAMAACQGTDMPGVYWNKPWVISLPA